MENNQLPNQSTIAIQAGSSSSCLFKQFKNSDKKQQSYMPFLFKGKRTDFVDHTPNPPPGQYDHKSIFERHNERDQLQHKYKLTMENSRKIKQSVVFKSAAKRFNYKQTIDNTPISYSYRYSQASNASSHSKNTKSRRINSKTLTNISQKQLCPSIPNNSIKFGYTLGQQGKLTKINKTQQQLRKQKQAMKKYVKQLHGQKSYNNTSQKQPDHKRSYTKFTILQRLKNKVEQSINNDNMTIKSQKLTHKITSKKPILKSNSKCNQNKLFKIRQQKHDSVQKLGPGCYQAHSNSFGNQLKPQKFQFFNSTAQRFKQKAVLMETSFNKTVKMMEIDNKMFQAQKTKSTNFWKGLKRPHRSSEKSYHQSQSNEPGPADYDPNPNSIKSKIGKNSSFEKSPRFDYLRKKQEIIFKIKQSSKRFGMQKGRIEDIQSQNKQNQEAKSESYNTIIQRNKQFLKNKKQIIEQQYKRYKTKGQSDYSICSWQNRPFSRNQGIVSVNKQSAKGFN